MTNWKATQVAGALKANAQSPVSAPTEVKTKYLSMGSWKANLSKHGQKRVK